MSSVFEVSVQRDAKSQPKKEYFRVHHFDQVDNHLRSLKPASWGHVNKMPDDYAGCIHLDLTIEKPKTEINLVPQAEVFTIHGADPEVQAYAMAKYSRSALSMKEAITEINSQKAEQFLNTFYFAYGHKSIADLAHIPMAIEKISLLAAIEVVDEQRWDGQERSTRYQDFSKRQYYVPEGLNDVEATHYHSTMHMLFDAYEEVLAEAEAVFIFENPKPEGMNEEAYRRTIKARAFDVARYLLPMSTLTSVGQITNARTLEGQISRMLASPYAEVRDIADKMKAAATSEPSFQVGETSHQPGEEKYAAPTLVKHAEVNTYKIESAKLAKRLLESFELDDVDEVIPHYLGDVNATKIAAEQVEDEILATFLYEQTNLPFRYVLDTVQQYKINFKSECLGQLLAIRGKYDEHLRPCRSQGGVIFDITMDIGGMRDMHRHRRATQIAQAYNAIEFSVPEPICSDKLREVYEAATRKVRFAFEIMQSLRRMSGAELGPEAYLLPLGAKCRFLMKMDVAEIAYIAELRTGPAGHISYRRVAWAMYRELEKIAPTLAASIADRVTDPESPLDFFKR